MISDNEREFILSAIKAEQRVDGRRRFDYRRIHIAFGKEDGSVEVQLGQTRVLAVVSAELSAPYPDRPNEGSLATFTEFSPMADPSFEPGRPGEGAVELGRIVDRGLRESRAVDTEALCVVAGRAVWALRIDCHVLDNGGNLVDATNLAALAGLLAFRRPEVTVGGDDGQEVTVHPPEERDPLPLAIHHLPVAVTFAFFNDGEDVVADPSLKEEVAMGGRLTLTLNVHGELCAIQKGGGVPVRPAEILRCMRIARNKAKDLTDVIRGAVEAHERQRQERKVKRHPVTPPGGGGLRGREVVLRDRDLAPDQNVTDAERGAEPQLALGPREEEGEGGREIENGEAGAGAGEGEDMEQEDEEEGEEGSDDSDDDEGEDEEEPGAPRRVPGAPGGSGPTGSREPFMGGISSWLDEDDKAPIGRGRGPRKFPDAEAMDEFERVAAMLGGPKSGPGGERQGKVAAAAVYASRAKESKGGGGHQGSMAGEREDEEVTVGLKGEFAASRDQKKAQMAAEEEMDTLVAAVKPRKGKKKRPLGKG